MIEKLAFLVVITLILPISLVAQQSTAIDAIHAEKPADIVLHDLEFENLKRPVLTIEWPVESIEIKRCKFKNCSQILLCLAKHGASTPERLEVVIEDNIVEGGSYFGFYCDLVVDATVKNNRCSGGTNEAFLFADKSLQSTYEFTGNHFENYINRKPGGDPDGHFIRAYGSKITIDSNFMQGLHVAEGTKTSDTEAVYLRASESVEFVNNTLIDAGIAEGMFVCKQSPWLSICDNTFVCTDDYGHRARAVLVSNGGLELSRNRFFGAFSVCVDTQGNWGDTNESVLLEGNLFSDVPAAGYSFNSLISLRGKSTRIVTIRDNRVSASPYISGEVRTLGGRIPTHCNALGSHVYFFENNDWRARHFPYYGRAIPKLLSIKNDKAVSIRKGKQTIYRRGGTGPELVLFKDEDGN